MMSRIIGVNSNCYHGYSIDEALEGIAAAGFHYVELTATKGWTEHVFPDQSFASLCHVQDKLKELDLVPFAMSGHTNLMDADRLPDFIMNMRLAHFFGCKYIVSSIGEAHLKDKAKTGNEVLVQNIKGLIPHLKENGLMLVLELHGEHATGTIMNEIVTAVNSNLVKINYDTANCVFYGNVDAADDIDTCMDNVAYLHIGNIMVVCGVVMYVVLDNGLPTFIAVLAGLVTGAACGLLNGAIIAKSKCIPLVITLGTSKMFYGIALTVSGGRIMNFGGAFNGLKTKYFEIFSPMLLVLLAMVMVAYLMMTYTKFGRRVVALGGNEKNAFLSGINVNRYKIIVYGISGLFCAVASIVFVARIDSITSNAGTNYETNALAAAIIGGVTFDGGKGTISGAFLGCLLMGVISNAMNILGVDNNVQTIITGAIIVAAVVLSNINNIKKK